jgi:hypothetical protein
MLCEIDSPHSFYTENPPHAASVRVVWLCDAGSSDTDVWVRKILPQEKSASLRIRFESHALTSGESYTRSKYIFASFLFLVVVVAHSRFPDFPMAKIQDPDLRHFGTFPKDEFSLRYL